MKTCPCCGQTLPDESLPPGLVLRNNQLKIFKLVKRAGPNGIDTRDLLDAFYADHPDGGPLWAKRSLYVQIHRLNSALIDYGLVIRSIAGGKNAAGVYTLRQVNA